MKIHWPTFYLCSIIIGCFIAVLAFFLIHWPLKTTALLAVSLGIAILAGRGMRYGGR